MNIKDKADVWAFTWPGKDPDTIYYEDGTTAPLTTSQLVVPFGKYKDLTLDEVTDRRYLEWMLQSAVDKGEWWQEKTVRMRLKELE